MSDEKNSTAAHEPVSSAKVNRPLARKVIGKLRRSVRGQVVPLGAVAAGRADAEKLQETVVSRDALAALHPAHAAYVYTQNQLSVMTEQLTALDELARFVKIISDAEDEYMPSGPPMSPLTTSFFTCWALFDVSVGLARETLATTAIEVGAAFGMSEELQRSIGRMQRSRMGIYVHEGTEGDAIVLRELVTDAVCRAINPSGYPGREGEMWYVRVMPPPLPDSEHVVFTTPYVLVAPGLPAWEDYFRRTLPDGPREERIARYEQHMKQGPARNYWTEFVHEAYVNHCPEAIFLAGLPDIAESRPHSRLNS